MKRDIACNQCTVMWREHAKDPEVVASGEKVSITAGKARRDFLCDHCGASLPTGTACHAVGVVMPGQQGIPGWEHEFIEAAS